MGTQMHTFSEEFQEREERKEGSFSRKMILGLVLLEVLVSDWRNKTYSC